MMVSDRGRLFPHDTVREGQNDLIDDLRRVVDSGKILIAHAPTGLGKTASALSVALEKALQQNKKVFFITNRHTQHHIAISTLKMIQDKRGVSFSCVDLIGKRWMCNQEVSGLYNTDFTEFCKAIVEKGECEFYNNVHSKKGVTTEAKVLLQELGKQSALHTEELQFLTNDKRFCSYEIALELAKKANVIICDYNYIFNPFVQSTLLHKITTELEDIILIVDEGHNLPQRVTDMVSSSLTTIMIKNAIVEAKKFSYHGIIFWLQEMMRILDEIANVTSEKEKLISKKQWIDAVTKVVDYDDLIQELELAAEEIRKKQRRSYLGGIASFLASWKGNDDGFTRIMTERQGVQGQILVLQYLCLDPSTITKDIFARVHSGIIMSGTLKPTLMYKNLLGIGRGEEREYGSPFPPENKLSIIIPETSTKYTLRGEAMFQKIAAHCSAIASFIPGNSAFFFPSYDLRDKIGTFFRTERKIFWEKSTMTKEEKDAFIAAFKAEQEKGAVLLAVTGANFAEGVDFPGDLLKGVVVVGLPLAKPDLKTQEIIRYYDHKFGKGWDYGYIYPAMNKCFQSAGRCIRSEDDRGVVIYLDERFVWPRYYDCFPKEGLIVSRHYEKLLQEFFRK
ncbi:MAG: ATP-dependent DNA helicase [Nanoarchaeota archaeon]|nr:ATP-dependent DNA helicase [Nanoarchaeota archaeon]